MALTKVQQNLSSTPSIVDNGNATAITIDSSENIVVAGTLSNSSYLFADQNWVTGQINNLVASAPGALNTLNELAAAMGDDANFSTTTTNNLALKAPLANPDFTGQLQVSNAANTIQEFTVTGNSTRSTLRLNSKDSSGNSVDLRMHTAGDGPRAEVFTFTNHDLAFSTNNAAPQMILKTDGKVGIGTQTPTNNNLLHIKKAGFTRAAIEATGNNQSGLKIIRSSSDYDTNWEIYSPGNSTTLRFYGGGDRLTLKTDGNVGIGTTNPSAKLHLATTGSEDMALGIQNSERYYKIHTDGGNLRFTDVSAGLVERMAILANGTVGIGTASPAFENGNGLEIRNSSGNGAHLKLTDNASGTGGTQGFDLYMFNGQAYIENYENNPTIFRNNGGQKMRIDASGEVFIGKNASSNTTKGFTVDQDGLIQTTKTGSGGQCVFLNRQDSDGIHILFRKANSTVGSIGVVASNNLYINGDTVGLGIGDDNLYPTNSVGNSTTGALDIGDSSAKFRNLHLSGTASVGTKVITKTTNGEVIRFERASDALRFSSIHANSTDAGGAFIQFKVHTGASATSTADVMTLKGNDRVGIGTANPASKLHLESGNAHNKLSITSTANGGTGYDASIDLLGSAANSESAINMGVNSDADREAIKTYQSAMTFRTNNTERMRIDSVGDVHIGQTSQTGYAFAQKLVVGDGDNNDGITIQSGSTHQGNLAFNHSDGTTALGRISYQHGTNYMQFYINNALKLQINKNGLNGEVLANGNGVWGTSGTWNNVYDAVSDPIGTRFFYYVDLQGLDGYTSYGYVWKDRNGRWRIQAVRTAGTNFRVESGNRYFQVNQNSGANQSSSSGAFRLTRLMGHNTQG